MSILIIVHVDIGGTIPNYMGNALAAGDLITMQVSPKTKILNLLALENLKSEYINEIKNIYAAGQMK